MSTNIGGAAGEGANAPGRAALRTFKSKNSK